MKEHMKYELKQENNLVIEFSTAAYELAKKCLYEMVKSENFECAVENRNSLDLSGANVDSCIKIFNKKADGSCGRMLKFVINFSHTTSQILVNGNKTDLFISNILDELCSEMKEKCSQLDILNINIASALSYKPQSTVQITKMTMKLMTLQIWFMLQIIAMTSNLMVRFVSYVQFVVIKHMAKWYSVGDGAIVPLCLYKYQ